jgi:serine/threonine protein phosphatase 1
MRILAISDIHGMLEKLNKMLEMVNYDPKEDKLILLGDYVDRGPESIKTLQKVMELVKDGAVALMGNHEDMFFRAVMKQPYWQDVLLHKNNGGVITQDQFYSLPESQRQEIRDFIFTLPKITTKDDFIFVHAGVNPWVALPSQDPVDYLWIRDEFIYGPTVMGKTVIFGHTPTSYMQGRFTIWHGPGKIGIDCGAPFCGRLACLEIPTMREYYC